MKGFGFDVFDRMTDCDFVFLRWVLQVKMGCGVMVGYVPAVIVKDSKDFARRITLHIVRISFLVGMI